MDWMNKLAVQDFVKGYSIETTIREAARIERFADIVPLGTRLYIVHVPGAGLHDTVALARRLRTEGMEPVPHIVARRIESLPVLEDFLQRLKGEAAVRQVLVVAGDAASSANHLDSSLQILNSGLLEKYAIQIVGVAGYPEGHPRIGDAELRDALRRKNAYARKTGAHVYIVTQFTFAAQPIIAWESSHGADIGTLPITAGLPGLATARTLLKFALDCGVGPSLQAFSKHASSLTRLLTIAAPDTTIVELAGYKQRNPQTRITGVHFFPFGGFRPTAEWANNIVQGNFEFNEDGLKVGSSSGS
jgi:methylenetetrahydrofolate reductase (NADPH)